MSKSILVVTALVSVGVYKVLSHRNSEAAPINQLEHSVGTIAAASAITPGTHPSKSSPSFLHSSSHSGSNSNVEAARRDLRHQIQILREDVESRRLNLSTKTQDLERIRARAGDRKPASTTATADIASRNEELRTLSNNLNEMHISGENIRQQEDYAIRVRENATKLAVSKLDYSLQRMEQWSAHTQAQLERWLQQHVLRSGETAHNEDLENTIQQQQQQIESIREQRQGVTAENHRRADNIYNLGQQAREDLRSKEQNLRGQMFSLQSEIRGIESDRSEDRSSRSDETSRYQQGERDIQFEADKLQSLETALLAKQAELKSLD